MVSYNLPVVSSPCQKLHMCTCTVIQQIRIMTMATADYINQVRTHNYNHPSSQLANGGCCQFYPHYNFMLRKCIVSGCKNRFYYCLRSLGSAEADCSGGNTTYTSEVNSNDRPLNFFHPTVLGLPNPLPLPELTREWKVSCNYST